MKNILKNVIVCCLCAFATAQVGIAQSIQFKGGSCVLDTVVEVPGGAVSKFLRVDLKYTLDQDLSLIDFMHNVDALIKNGTIAVGKKKFQAHSFSMDTDINSEKVKPNGVFSLQVAIPADMQVETVKLIYKKQESVYTKKNNLNH